jgi:hypothetical protein
VKASFADGMFQRGGRDWPRKSGGCRSKTTVGRVRTTVPGVKGAPCPVGLAHVQHDNPVAVRRVDRR